MTEITKHSWWLDLRHGGMLISPAVLEEVFPMDYDKPLDWKVKFLREKYSKFAVWWNQEGRSETQLKPIYDWTEYLFETFLGLVNGVWLKGPQLTEDHSVTTILKEKIKPNRLFYKNKDDQLPFIALFVDGSQRLGIGKSRKNYGRMLQYLRTKGIKIGILTNGSQIRLCYAGLDHESWVEWDVTNWFELTEFLPQLFGFYTLLGPTGVQSRNDFDTPLLYAIESSRTRQGELSTVLGEQIRQAIELLVDEFNRTREKDNAFIDPIKKSPDGATISDEVVLSSIFQSSVRIIMRMVVVLFAEARDLLPRSNERYHTNYGLEGLFENLRHARSAESSTFMDDTSSEWLRLLGLFRLIHLGSPHPDIQIPRYGGELFAPGKIDSYDPVERALALFEDRRLEVTNGALLSILEKLKYGKLKIKKGRTSTFVKGPVNFGELRTEYIGMIYEGILNYGLRSASETMLLLNTGMQPILPLSVLETLTDSQMKDLFEKLSKKDKEETEEETSDEDATADESANEEEEIEEIDEEEAVVVDNVMERAQQWGQKAVITLGWVKKPKKKEDQYTYDITVRAKARTLIKKTYATGDYYLSLWGGTRKGTGTFYTKPQLAVPTVRRTLEPLVFDIDEQGNKTPKLPEVILSIKVCDPSCGSASFLVAATQYLTESLFESLVYHCQLTDASDYIRKTLPLGLKVDSPPIESMLPCSPDEDGFEEKVKARLRRSVVEHCIYGVDLNPMAVELARLSLWIETMDRDLPFEFLDHKLKVGNSLVGAWLDTFQEYPLAAWLREGGDKSHPTSVHHKQDTWNKAIKDRFQNVIKPEMAAVIRLRSGQEQFSFMGEEVKPKEIHKELLDAYFSLHSQASSFFGLEQKEKIYLEQILRNPHYLQLKDAMDLWCSIWFWQPDILNEAPTPRTFYSPSIETLNISRQIAQKHRFFHWEIEFPDVFNAGRIGFDAMLGNPPWEISKPNSKEFFSRIDPMYRSYGKQEALDHQRRVFSANDGLETNWLNYYAGFKWISNFAKNCFAPFGDPTECEENEINLIRGKDSLGLHSSWRLKRKKYIGFANAEHPYRFQGSADLNLYKMFLELSYYVMKNGGRMGLIVPSGVYSDKGSKHLRSLFLEKSNWEWLFSFENKKAIFDIHRSYKFNPIIIEKGGTTTSIKTAFMRHNVSDWELATGFLEYHKDTVKKLSPFNLSLLEITTPRDAEIIGKIYDNSILLGDKSSIGWGLDYATEFHMTSDSKYFHNRFKLLEKGFKQDLYGRLVGPEGEIMLPLYQGVMIWQFDFSSAGYLSGAGNRAKWRDIEWNNKSIEAQFYVKQEVFDNWENAKRGLKLVFRDVSGATNERTAVASLLNDVPCGNVLGILHNPSLKVYEYSILSICMNSLVYDYVVRQKMVGSHLNLFVIDETPLFNKNKISKETLKKLGLYGMGLNLPLVNNFNLWLGLRTLLQLESTNVKQLWFLKISERTRVRAILDAISADLYGLSFVDLEWILQNDESNPKGFWRVDKEKPKELRHTTLALLAFKRLKEVGFEEFLKEDWQLPPDVQSALGSRFYDWQLQGTPEESWKECEYYAKQSLGEEGYKRFMIEIETGKLDSTVINEPSQAYSKKKKKDDDQLSLM